VPGSQKTKNPYGLCLIEIGEGIRKERMTTKDSGVTDTDSKEYGWRSHTSAVCRLYAGMESDRHVWCAYLLVHEGSRIISVLPVGIQANKPAGPASVLQAPAGVDIYANCIDGTG